ncbi:hypothetical protein CC86DRAFT_12730 [Ophiobolus disseminans]|uniref:Uncharacterized protein n=1 Tax=Ophiobolus disseminans TaxID=1469910 RepID=A0A6A7AK26_9PLEO|nr:hypothetical protein CC86DRAFT_12730 [Ophiobolus disseminans]
MRKAQLGAFVLLATEIEAQLFTNGSSPTHSFNLTISNADTNSTRYSTLFNATTLPVSASATNATASLSSFNATTVLSSSTTSTHHNATITRSPILPTSLTFPNTTITSNSTRSRNACQAQYDAYDSYLWWGGYTWTPSVTITSITTVSQVWEFMTLSTELYECTSTCGNICYANNVTTIISHSKFTQSETRTYYKNEPFPITTPNCTIPFKECLGLQTSYASAMTSFNSMGDEYAAYNQEPVRPYCSACVSTSCYFNGMFAMSLYYWPPTSTTSRDYCTSEPVGGRASKYAPDVNHTYVPTTTGPYAVVDGVTMYQGNVYVSYWEPQVYDNCHTSISRRNPESHRIITVASDALYSIRKYPDTFALPPVKWDLIPWPFNFDDFHEPVPWSAYSGQETCAKQDNGVPRDCGHVVKPNEYWPYVLMPPQIRDLDPAWASCNYNEYAVFDPPIALKPVDMFSSSQATPTAGGEARPIVTPPAPGQPGGGGFPVVTPRPGGPPLQAPQAPSNYLPDPTQSRSPAVSVDVPRPVVTIGSSVIPVDPSSGLVIRPGVTIKPGDPPTVIDGTTFSFGSTGVVVADGKGTTTFAVPAANPQVPVVTVGSSVFPIDSPGRVIIRPGVTLKAGERPVVIDGTIMYVGPSGVVMIDETGSASTIPIPAVAFETPAITIGPSVVPFDASGGLIVRAGQTLRPGDPAIAIGGTTYSIGLFGVTIIDNQGTSTIPFPMLKEYITVGAQTYTMINGNLVMGPGLTLSGPGGMIIMAGTTVMLKSESVEIVGKSGTSIVPLKSKIHGSLPSSGGLSRGGAIEQAKETGKKESVAAASALLGCCYHFFVLAVVIQLIHEL